MICYESHLHTNHTGSVWRWLRGGLLLLPLVDGRDGHPPALDLAELSVGELDAQGQAGHPHAHLQLGAQVAVGKVHQHPHAPAGLLPIHVHKIAALGHLGQDDGEKNNNDRLRSVIMC